MFFLWQDSFGSTMRALCMRMVCRSLEADRLLEHKNAWEMLLQETLSDLYDGPCVMENLIEDLQDEYFTPLDTVLTLSLLLCLKDKCFPNFEDPTGEVQRSDIVKALSCVSRI